MPAKLDRCVDDLKAKGGVDNPWAVCNASIGKETKGQIIQEKVNSNRMRPSFNPPIKVGKIEPQINKTTKGIGGLEGQIGKPVKNPKPSFLWKDILDAQLRQNVKEPDI